VRTRAPVASKTALAIAAARFSVVGRLCQPAFAVVARDCRHCYHGGRGRRATEEKTGGAMADRLNLDARTLQAEVARLRRLARRRPEAGERALAAALIGLGLVLRRDGRSEQALAALAEGVRIQRRHDPADPRRAPALLALAWLLHERHRPDAVLRLADEARTLLIGAGPANPTELALWAEAEDLRTLALLAQDRLTEAEAACRAALAAGDRDPSPQARAAARWARLARLGEILNRQGRCAAALPVLREARALQEMIAAGTHPVVWQRRRAELRVQLAFALSGTGQWDDALTLYQQAIAADESWALDHPDDALPRLAYCWTGLAACWWEGRRDARRAEAALRASVAIYRRLAERQPEVHGRGLVEALLNLARFLGREENRADEPRRQEARQLVREALGHLRPPPGPERARLAEEIRADFARFCHRVASTARPGLYPPPLRALAARARAGADDAARLRAEAADLRALAGRDPAHAAALARTLLALGAALREERQGAAALAALAEGAALLADRRPTDPERAQLLLEYAEALVEADQAGAAAETLAVLLDGADAADDADPAALLPRAEALLLRFELRAAAGQERAAEAAAREAIALLRAAGGPPGRHGQPLTLARALFALARFLVRRGRAADAAGLLREAALLLQTLPPGFSGDLLRAFRSLIARELAGALERIGTPPALAEAAELHRAEVRACRVWADRQPAAWRLAIGHLRGLERCLAAQGRFAAAAAAHRQAVALVRRARRPTAPDAGPGP